ncbi:hypothetical protein JYK21_13420 [Ralstonia pickettii]|nr:hypothetical protein [Ralstonia pickettii]
MSAQHTVAAPRKSYLLVDVGVQPKHAANRYAVADVTALDPTSIKLAAKRLSESAHASFPTAKHMDWQHGLARALGAKSYNDWLHTEYPRLQQFVADNAPQGCADLLTWNRAPIWGGSRLTGRVLADRLFAADRPVPQKVFTGPGSKLFSASGYGRLDLHDAMAKDGIHCRSEEEELEWSRARWDDVVLRAERLSDWPADAPSHIDLTGRALYVTAMWDQYGAIWNLLGDSLVSPAVVDPVYQLYNASPEEMAMARERYLAFREEIESSDAGWVDVLPFNSRITILRSQKTGRYDIVFRDQRDKPLTQNPFYPVFSHHELPTSIGDAPVHTALYYREGLWEAKLEHAAETHYYATGGLPRNWPGTKKLIERYLRDNEDYRGPRTEGGANHPSFVRHDLGDRSLMVSELISIDKFWRFYEAGWADTRASKVAAGSKPWANLAATNMHEDSRELPACVTWFDAIAYCKHLEDDLDRPVRLLTIDEWRSIRPTQDIVNAARDFSTELGMELVTSLDSRGHTLGDERPYKFQSDILWLTNSNGLPFLVSRSFGEWLWDYMGTPPDYCFAPAACAATGQAVSMGPLERVGSTVRSTDNHHGHKIGFRVCYDEALNS